MELLFSIESLIGLQIEEIILGRGECFVYAFGVFIRPTGKLCKSFGNRLVSHLERINAIGNIVSATGGCLKLRSKSDCEVYRLILWCIIYFRY